MVILGIDPGFAIVGVGIIEYKGNKFRTIDYFAVTTKAGTPIEQRLKIIYDEISEAIARYKPDVIAVEELFFNNNAKTAIQVGQASAFCCELEGQFIGIESLVGSVKPLIQLTILAVAQQGVACVSKLSANLVGTAGDLFAFHQGQSVGAG